MAAPTVVVSAGFTSAASTGTYLHLDDTARGKLDTGSLAGADVFTVITSDVRKLSIDRGVSRASGPVNTWDAGSSTVEANDNARNYDPTNLSGPYVSAGVTQVTPMRPIRTQAVHLGITYDLFRGFADSWDHEYTSRRTTVMTVKATDAVKVLGSYDRPAVAPVGAGENTGARIARILDSIAWPASDRVLDTGDTTLQATDLSGKAWTEAQSAQTSELGELYVDGSGRVVFRRRTGVLNDARSNISQATFGDGGGGELPFVSVGLSYDDQQLVNYARVTREGGVEQSAQDAASQTAYLVHTADMSGLLMQDDATALSYAQFLVYAAKDPELRFDSITLTRNATSATDDLLMAQMLGREIGDRITIKIRPAGGGSAISRDVFIRGIHHDAEPPAFWTTTWDLQSATRYQFLVLDHATLGKLDSNAIAY